MRIKILEFYKEAQISRILRYTRYTFLAIFGHLEAELTARALYQELSQQTRHPLLSVLFEALYARLNHQEWHQKRLYPYLKHIKSTGLMFDEDSHDPSVISQIKKIINVLQLAEEILAQIEKMGGERTLLGMLQDVNVMELTDKLYELCQLLIWPDIDLLSEFQEEYVWAKVIFEPLFDIVAHPDFFELVVQRSMSHSVRVAGQVGHQVGHGVAYLERPFNFDFFMDIKQSLAQYTEAWIAHVQSHFSAKSPSAHHHTHALELRFLSFLSSLERFSQKKWLRLGSIGDLARVLKHGHDLLWKMCYDDNHLGRSNQLRVKKNLDEFRMAYCLPLLSFFDKCEEKFILIPGGLSSLAEGHLESMFNAMTGAMKRFVYFDEEALTLMNSNFMKERLSILYERRATLRLEDVKSRSFLLQVNEDILNHVWGRQRLYQRSSCLLTFSSESPRQVSSSEYLGYLKQHEIFLEAKQAYVQFVEYKSTSYVHYDAQLRRGFYEKFRPLLPNINITIHEVKSHQRKIEATIMLLEKQFEFGVTHCERHCAREAFSPARSPAVELKYVLSHLPSWMEEKGQSLVQLFNEEAQSLLNTTEGDFLTHMGHRLTGSMFKLPYPEVSDPNAVLSEPTPLVWLKTLANISIHFKKVIEQCTYFDTQTKGRTLSGLAYQTAKAICIGHVVMVEHHARSALCLMMELINDDYLLEFYKARRHGLLELHQRVVDTIPHHAIEAVKPLVQQATSLLEKLHPEVRWFLHLPHVFDLLIELSALLSEEEGEPSQFIRKKLKDVQSILTLIQIEADASEEYFLLKQGTLTTPMTQVLLHFYEGFLRKHPFLWDASLVMTEARLKAVQKRMLDMNTEIQTWTERKNFLIGALHTSKHSFKGDTQLVRQVIHVLKEASSRCHAAYRACGTAEDISSLFDMKAFNQALFIQMIEIYLKHVEGTLKGKTLVKHAMLKTATELEKKKESEVKKVQSEALLEPIERVKQALVAFKRYIAAQYKILEHTSVTNVFETSETLDKKLIYLNQLEAILDHKEMAASSKYVELQSMVQKSSFKRVFFTYHRYDFFSFQWLWQCFWRVLTALSWYTPPCQKAYTVLTQALSGSEGNRWGFFNAPKADAQNSKERLYSYITTPG